MQIPVMRRKSKTYLFGGLVTAAGVWNAIAAVVPAIAAIPGVSPWVAVLGVAILALREKTSAPLAPLVKDRPPICMLLAVCALAAGAPACKGPGGGDGGAGVGATASFTAGEAGARPRMLVRWDTDTLVAWGDVSALFEVFIDATGLPVYIFPVAEDAVVVYVASTGFKWSGLVTDALPREALHRFRPGEIQAWALLFQPEQPAPP